MISRGKIIFIFISIVLLWGGLIYRLYVLQIKDAGFLLSKASKQHESIRKVDPRRGKITDRFGNLLAVSVKVKSVFCVPGEIENIWTASREISRVLNLDRNYLIKRMTRNSSFSWIKRKITDEQAEQIKLLDLKGIYFEEEVKRKYPNDHLLSHVIGFVNIDNKGMSGVEAAYDATLRGEPGIAKIMNDNHGREIFVKRNFVKRPQDGRNLKLTIDEVVQNITEEETDKLFKQFNPQGVAVIVLDVHTGEVLGLCNRPTFDLNAPGVYPSLNRRNNALICAYEPGSLFKVISAAAALSKGVTSLNEQIYCEQGAYRIAGHTLHDSHPHDYLSFAEILAKSSNIGFAKVMSRVNSKDFYEFIREFGFGSKTDIGIRGESRGLVWNYKKWSGYSKSAISMGHEIMATPIQMAQAISIIANGGKKIKPHIIKQPANTPCKQIISRKITSEISKALEMVVAPEGTAPKAKIEGVRVAGKTGTAQKIIDGKYSHSRYVSSFYGYLPAEDPEISITVMVDEPDGKIYGGTAAAPAFAAIGERVFNYMNPRPLAELISQKTAGEQSDAA